MTLGEQFKQPRLPGADWHRGDFKRVPHFASGAKAYAESQGLSHSQRGIASTRADPNNIIRIGNIIRDQQGTEQMTPGLAKSYEALKAGISSQFEQLTKPTSEGGMGIKVQYGREDPYSSPQEARADVMKNKRLRVLSTEATGGMAPGHPMSNEDNDKFRAVHDAFGHMATGRNFSRHGEEAAVQHHARMFPPEAHHALFSELRGQNSFLIAHKDFPGNQVYNLPQWASKGKAKEPTPKSRGKKPQQLRLF